MKELLKVENFSVYYQKAVVDNVSFTLHSGEIVGLIGHNGCGKSTMLRGIMGSLKYSGKVIVNDQDFMTMKIKQRAKKIAMLTQRIEIIEGISARELIALGNYAYLSMEQSSNDEILEKIAHGLHIEMLLDKDYAVLSEGQKQLVQIARIIMQDTPVFLLDEPDSALDFDNCHMTFKIIQQLIKNNDKATMMVIHNPLYALMYCDRILLMDNGKIIEEIKPNSDSCQMITKKIQLIYPNIKIKQDDEFHQYYYLVR